MKYTDAELEKILEKLVASTRSPKGRFSAAANYPKLEKRLPHRNKRLLPIRIFATAAAIALLCIPAWFAYNHLRSVPMQTVGTLAETRTVQLPDGTHVTLNHYSSLTYPERFKTANREVQLSGEAYFEVSKDRSHPFIVQTEAIDVQVLGTHFNVNAYRDNSEVKTTLLEGSVAVSNKSNSVRMILKPNESAIYNKVEQSLICEVPKNATEDIAWCNGEFIFSNLPLQKIARQLSNSFGVTIHISDTALQNYRITARFNAGESLEHILSLLQQAGPFGYSQNGNQITITTKQDLK